ncbi:MAG: hypothetical protein M1831_004354 [Alyxoria varia]|nr:MAG: hypothetical protein M1831_004354 [Alyxoria varia]
MSTAGQFNTKSPTVKRILREAREISSTPSSDYTAHPLESNLFEWHFTIRGPPPPSPYAGGLYHGRIVLPASYPLKPPSFRFLTPSGRFEPNREICLSISGHHEESWQPAWGIRTALVAIRAFMDSDAKGQVGGLDTTEGVRKRYAGESPKWKCVSCGKTCEEIMKEREQEIEEMGKGGDVKQTDKDVLPEGLKLGYKDELEGNAKAQGEKAKGRGEAQPENGHPVSPPANEKAVGHANTAPTPTATTRATRTTRQRPRPRSHDDTTSWLDLSIGCITVVLAVLIMKKLAHWL